MQNATFISKTLFPYFEKAGTLLVFHPHQHIYLQGDHAKDFYFIKKGRVRVYLLARDGHEVTLEIVECGRVFGEDSFFSKAQRLTSIEAITDVELVACDYEALLPQLQESPELLTIIFKMLAKTSRSLSCQVRRLCFLDAGRRIADFLLWMTEDPVIENEVTKNSLPYTHQEIAECTNLSRITVTRFLNEFAKAGWVKLQYRKVYIQNREALQSYVDTHL